LEELAMRIILFILASFYLSADDHEQSFEGLLSSERFNIDGGMELVIEKRSTCNAGNTPKHFHPAAGTVVYVLDGVSQSKSTGQWKQYSKGEYWFERSDWVHGGEADAPDLGDQCTDLLVIRVVDEGKEHTVFVD
jgi:quercetin dioxygenase-like cupin family protein